MASMMTFTASRPALGLARKPCGATHRAAVRRVAGRRVVAVRGLPGRYPDPEFINTTLQTFTNGEEAVADIEQGITLMKEGGYVYLDVRSELAVDTFGKVKGAINIPIIKAVKKWDSEKNDNVITTESLADDFIERVGKKYPEKDTKFLVACATGKQYSIDALIALDEAGYENLVGLKGGFNLWTRTFDNSLRRRGNPKYETLYNADGDGMGIHSTGAGFARMDSVSVVDADDY